MDIKQFNKDDIISLIGTILFHLLILLILWFTVLKTVVPEEEEGVLVNFGYLSAASGTFEPRYTGESVPQQTTTPPPAENNQEPLLTQDTEESASLSNAQKEEEARKQREEEERKKREEEERRRLAEEQRRQEAIDSRVSGAFGRGTTDEPGQGDAEEGTGNQGNPFGNSDQGPTEGVGGYGSFNLNGRSIGGGGQLPRPSYTAQIEGRIVIDITVDPKGDVISAEIGRGTNIDDASMRRSAIEAARRAKFNKITGTNNQSGTITYRYTLR